MDLPFHNIVSNLTMKPKQREFKDTAQNLCYKKKRSLKKLWRKTFVGNLGGEGFTFITTRLTRRQIRMTFSCTFLLNKLVNVHFGYFFKAYSVKCFKVANHLGYHLIIFKIKNKVGKCITQSLYKLSWMLPWIEATLNEANSAIPLFTTSPTISLFTSDK